MHAYTHLPLLPLPPLLLAYLVTVFTTKFGRIESPLETFSIKLRLNLC